MEFGNGEEERMEMFPAHGRTRNGEMLYQTVQAHSRGAAEAAKKALSGVRLGSAAYLAGLLHDAGKPICLF